jgi:DNA-binding response OmpR family regulator
MSKRVLVIDSSRVIRTLLQIHLQQAGHGVLVCSSSQEGLWLLRSVQEAPDLLFLAVHPAVKEDYEVIRSVSKSAQTRLIVMALQEDQAHIQRHLRETTFTYLLKPFRIEEALALVSAPLPGDGQAHSLTLGTRPAEREGSR